MALKRPRADSLSSSEATSTPHSRQHSPDIKIAHLDALSPTALQPVVISCSLPPHERLDFASFNDYDIHHQKMHSNRCSECHSNFPDEHFLHLHIAEYHDPINATKRERGQPTYACLLPECDRLCSTPQKRRLHCIDKHHFPRNYNFIIVKDGIDRHTSMLFSPHRRRSSTLSSAQGGTVEGGRRRGESFANAKGESMDGTEDEPGKEDVCEVSEEEDKELEARRYPTRLRGRGGFGHGQGLGRGRLVNTSIVTHPAKPASTTAGISKDPMDTLTSSLSALQFVPHSVRVARGRGRG